MNSVKLSVFMSVILLPWTCVWKPVLTAMCVSVSRTDAARPAPA